MTVDASDVDKFQERVDDLIEGIGDQITGSIHDTSEQGHPVKGRQAQHGDLSYQILCSTQIRHVQIESGFDAINALATDRALADADVRSGVQVGPSDIQTAQRDIIERADDKDPGQLYQDLLDCITVDDIEIGEVSRVDGYPTGFEARSRLFPYDREVTVPEFHETVQSLINVVFRGQELLVTEYDLRDLSGRDGGDGANIGFA